MSKYEIMHSSRPFLVHIYKKYLNRACENLGIPTKEEEQEQEDNDYPSLFVKLPPKEREEALKEFSSTEDFMSMFSSAKNYNKDTFKNLDEQKED